MKNTIGTKNEGLQAILLVLVLSGLFTSVSSLAATSLANTGTQLKQQAQLQTPTVSVSNLVIFRGSGNAATGSLNYRVYVDGKVQGKLRRNTAFHLRLSPGVHTITLNDAKRTRIDVQLVAGKTTYISAEIDRKWRAALADVSLQPSSTYIKQVAGLESCSAGFTHRCKSQPSMLGQHTQPQKCCSDKAPKRTVAIR